MERTVRRARNGTATGEEVSLEALVRALEETVPRYLRSLRRAVEQAEGQDRLTMQQFRCLQAVAAEGETALTTGLARRLRVAVPTMTRMLDGLVERGLVERRPDPTSRRQIRLALTDEGRGLLTRYEAVIEARLRRLLGFLDSEQRQRLLLSIGDLAGALDAESRRESV
jgi:DNA-binding MarR family transcriptional regulator